MKKRIYIYIYQRRKNLSHLLIAPLRSSFSATLTKRWKVQFRQGFEQFNNLDSKNDIKMNYSIKNRINCGRSKEILLTKQHVDKSPHEGKESGGTS